MIQVKSTGIKAVDLFELTHAQRQAVSSSVKQCQGGRPARAHTRSASTALQDSRCWAGPRWVCCSWLGSTWQGRRSKVRWAGCVSMGQHGSARVSIRQHGSARASTGQYGSARDSVGQRGPALVSMGQHGAMLFLDVSFKISVNSLILLLLVSAMGGRQWQGKFQLRPLRPRTTPFLEEKSILGLIYGVLLWADMNAATPLGARGRSVMSLEYRPSHGAQCSFFFFAFSIIFEIFLINAWSSFL